MFVTNERGAHTVCHEGAGVGGGYIFVWHDEEGVHLWHDEERVHLCLVRRRGRYIFVWHNEEGVQLCSARREGGIALFGTKERGCSFVWHDEEGLLLCLARRRWVTSLFGTKEMAVQLCLARRRGSIALFGTKERGYSFVWHECKWGWEGECAASLGWIWLKVLNAVLPLKRPKFREVGKGGCTERCTVTTGMILHEDGQSHKTMSINHRDLCLIETRAETESSRGRSACQPNALPPGKKRLTVG